MPLGPEPSIVPVLMFHSVGLRHLPWAWNHLSEPLERFTAFLDYLARNNFHTIGFGELRAHMTGEQRAPDQSIVLTFDDGYLDNWVYVAPLLEKYGFRGTVFASTDFIDPGSGLRPSLADAWSGTTGSGELAPAGFMNADELRAVDRSGILDVQSHARTHTWHYTGPRIVGWHRTAPPSPWPWMAWNARPDRKPFYLTEDQSGFVLPGTPVLEHACALVARRFVPDPDAVEAVRRAVLPLLEAGTTPAGRQRLVDLAGSITGPDGLPGQWESEQKREARTTEEIAGSRRTLGEMLDKPIDTICWPAGGSDEFCEQAAEDAGYASWTLRSSQQRDKRNRPGADPRGIRRLGGQRWVHFRGRSLGEGGTGYQRLQIDAHRGSAAAGALLRAYKLLKWARLVPAGT
jgi:peptidoglycan/xylan/chitin deacetylase (PgdA/CDA1 family)